MDENDFFRQVTLRICGNLEIEEAMYSSLLFLQKSMPVDRMFLQCYDQSFGAMRTIAAAAPSGCHKLNLLTPLSEEARTSAKMIEPPVSRDVLIFEDPQKYAISREMIRFHDIQCTSLLVMFLKSKEQVIGNLVLITEGEKKYTEQHARLLSLVQEPFAIATSNTIEHREVLKLKDLMADDNRYLHGELRRISGDEIIGANFGLRSVMKKVRQVATMNSPVLLLGETGVGKDVIANAIHYLSTRGDGPFVSVNCGAIPNTLIDSELFGHEKGAFTGALSQKRGRFERANQGTIFLDEIGELPPQAQVRLLKVLQSKEIERVGGNKTILLDIRIIAATNRDLEKMVDTHQFREDLWFRLNVFPIWIPPLRERKPDILALLQHFISLKARELKLPTIPTLSTNAVDPLMEYHWPGNVRELENVVERALILNPTGPLTFEYLHLGQPKSFLDMQKQTKEIAPLNKVISQHIYTALSITKGKVNGVDGAAALLRINPSTLRNRMKKLGIVYGRKSYY